MKTLAWESVLAIEGHPTVDRRFLIPDTLANRELPLSLMVMTVTDEGHDGAELGGRIDTISKTSVDDALARGLLSEEQAEGITEGAIVVVGTGVFDDSDVGRESARLVDEKMLRGVSVDLGIREVKLLDANTFEEVNPEDLDIEELLMGDFLTGLEADIVGATVVPFPAFAEATIRMQESGQAVVASAFVPQMKRDMSFLVLTAAGGPLKPPRSCFQDPGLPQLTALTITDDGFVFGHLADWDGCHTGFSSMCVPPFASNSNYAYFNVGQIETAEGDLVNVGKIMFSMEGGKHAPLDPGLSVADVAKHYDDSTKVGAYVRAGSDRFGTWLAGVLRPDLSEAEVQHLRLHPPSGDWRPIPGKGTELVAAFCVPIPGFPIARAMAASGDMAFITAPLEVEPMGIREFKRRKRSVQKRAYALLGPRPDDDGPAAA